MQIDDQTRMAIYRAIDKYDRLGADGVRQLLTTGRRDASGDWTLGIGLPEAQADLILSFVSISDNSKSNEETLFRMKRWFAIMAMTPEELSALEAELKAVGAM